MNNKKILISNTVELSKSVTIYFDGIGETDGFQFSKYITTSVTLHFTSELETVDKVFTSMDDLDPITIMYTNEISISIDMIRAANAWSDAEIDIVSGGSSLEYNSAYLNPYIHYESGSDPSILIPSDESVHLYIRRFATSFTE